MTEEPMDYGNECIVPLRFGATLRCDSHDESPDGVSYLRICDPDGAEIVYWTIDEVREDPELVLAAFMGAAKAASNGARAEIVREWSTP